MSDQQQTASQTPAQLLKLVVSSLEDFKTSDIRIIDVSDRSAVTDAMVIASGNSTRHVKSAAEALIIKAKQAGYPPLGVEGESGGEWVLVDLNDVVVHVMLPKIRDFYNLEKLWSVSQTRNAVGAET